MNKTDLKNLIAQCNKTKDFSALNNIDISRIKNLDYLFSHCDNLTNVEFTKSWDMQNVESLEGIFHECVNLNDISACQFWDLCDTRIKNKQFAFWNAKQIQLVDGILFFENKMNDTFRKNAYLNMTQKQLLEIYKSFCTYPSFTPQTS